MKMQTKRRAGGVLIVVAILLIFLAAAVLWQGIRPAGNQSLILMGTFILVVASFSLGLGILLLILGQGEEDQ